MWRSWWSSRMTSIRIISPSASITRRSGCVPASTRRGSPSSAPASARAATRFPTPVGPWKRYACDGPSSSAAWSSRFASTCSGTSAKALTNLLGDLRNGTPAVDDEIAPGETLRERVVGIDDPRPELRPGPLDAVALAPHARQRRLDVDVEQDRAVGEQPADREQVQLQDGVRPEPAPRALVGDRGVEVPIADDHRPAVEGGADHLVDVLGPGGDIERGLGPRRDVVAVQHEVADLLAERRASRLSGEDDVHFLGLETLQEEARLGGLSGAVEALERDEHRAGR